MEKRVVVIGSGFGGLKAAKALGRSDKVSVHVIDRKNHHLFQPLLYQVATASLSPSDIGVPIRLILSANKNTQVHMEAVLSVDLAGKKVVTDADVHPFDYLVMACGSTHSYFGHDEWEDLAPGLKTIEQALEIRRRILIAFELAEKEADPAKQARLLTFVIIGGGPTGVELAGAVSELSKSIVSREFRNIKSDVPRVILVDGGDRLIAAFAPPLSEKARQVLEKRGVEILLHKRAEGITPEGVRLEGRFIETHNIMWAAGVKPSPLNKTLGVPLDKEGRVIVNPDLSVPEHPNAFVIGDQARFDTPHGPLPGLAAVATQQGRAVADIILGDLAGKERKPFRYVDKGTMAVIGRAKAVVQFPFIKLSGYLAWLIWIFVHIMLLVGHRNRVIVLLNWAWSYFTFKGGARLITQSVWKQTDSASPPIQSAAAQVTASAKDGAVPVGKTA